MTTPIVDTVEVLELDSCYSTVRLDDERGVPVPSADMTSLEMTIYGQSPDDIINNRDSVSVLNANGGIMHATNGEVTMNFASADNPILNPTAATGTVEDHFAKFVAKWGSNKRKTWLVRLRVKQLHRVPEE